MKTKFVLAAALVLCTSVEAKKVICVDGCGSGFVSNHEGYIRGQMVAGDVIQVGGSLTDCLAMLANGDELVIIAHGTGTGTGFVWGAAPNNVYTGFGAGPGLMPVPPGFGNLTNITFEFCSCWSNRDPDGVPGGNTSLVDKLKAALGAGAAGTGFTDLAESSLCYTLTGGTGFLRWLAGLLLDDADWSSNPPTNRPGGGANQQTAAQAILDAALGAGTVTITVTGYKIPVNVVDPPNNGTGCGCTSLPGCGFGPTRDEFNGSDDCATPTPIAGDGAWPYYTYDATTSGFDGGGTCATGASSINQDVFFAWTALQSGNYVISTCQDQVYDTKLAVHLGADCSATCVAYSDDDCGLGSLLYIQNAQAGEVYLIQCGGFGSAIGRDLLEIRQLVPTCSPTLDDTLEDNDDCASAVPMSDGFTSGLYASKTDKDHYSFSVANGATVTIDLLFISGDGDIDGFLRSASSPECGTGNGADELADGFSGSDNENIVWTNSSGAAMDVILEVNVWDDLINADCNTYDMLIQGSGSGDVTSICDPADLNSTGFPTVLSAILGVPTGSGLHLEASQGPSGSFGYFLVGTGAADPGMPISQGHLCLDILGGNQFGRYNVAGGALNSIGQFGPGGVLQNLVGTSLTGTGYDVPQAIPFGGTIVAGDTWYFQLWHRDGAGQSNFSNGLCVQF